MDYQSAWKFLDDLQFFKIKLGLDSMRSFLARLGRPEERLRFIHLAGTNGKGSTGAMLHAILSRAGFRTGFYTSPHLTCVRERFRIGEEYISEEEFATCAEKIIKILGEDRITYFEFTTALAFLWFAARNCDLVVLETGLGGRLDATNVVTPLVSVITNVAMDHEAYLGDTIEQVAAEKGGIVKEGVPVVCGAEGAAAAIIEKICRERNAPLCLLGRDFSASGSTRGWQYRGRGASLADLPMNLAGAHQVTNGAIVLAALECLADHGVPVTEEKIRAGLAAVRWPGRMEMVTVRRGRGERRVLIDGAHNPAGAESLARELAGGFPRRRLVVLWAAMSDKDVAATLGRIAPLADVLVLSRPEYERSAAPEDMAAMLNGFRGVVHCRERVADGLDLALSEAGPDDLVLVAGSLYLVGQARELLAGGLV